MQVKQKYKGEGHRERLRQRFMQDGLRAFLDYEIVELLLTLGTPRKDCKDMAKELIEKFGGLRQVLDSPIEELSEVKGVGRNNAFGLKLFQAIAERYEYEKLKQKVTLDSSAAVAKYLHDSIGRKEEEHFLIMCLKDHFKTHFANLLTGLTHLDNLA